MSVANVYESKFNEYKLNSIKKEKLSVKYFFSLPLNTTRTEGKRNKRYFLAAVN